MTRRTPTPEHILRRQARIALREGINTVTEAITEQTFTEGGDKDMLRPVEWADYIGQESLKTQLQTAIASAKQREATLRPILLAGVAGCGKTTLATIIANDLDVPLVSHIWPITERTLCKVVQSRSNVVLFLDEIHRGTDRQKEMLLPLLEDGYVEDARGRHIHADRIHIVGATTEADRIIKPLWDRFLLRPPFDEYSDLDMARIALRMAFIEGLEAATFEWAMEIGQASLATPRYALSLVESARDMQQETGEFPSVNEVLAHARITDTGLTADHVKYLDSLAMAGGQAGLDLMKQLLDMPARHIERLEVDLIRQALLTRERAGRELTQDGFTLARKLKENE